MMRRICAWCGKELAARDAADAVQATHGLCPACRQQYFTRRKDGPVATAPPPAAAEPAPAPTALPN